MTREDRQICTIVLSCYSMNKEFLAHIQQSHAYKILKAILISPCILIKYGGKKKHNLKCLIVVIKGNFHFHKKKIIQNLISWNLIVDLSLFLAERKAIIFVYEVS